MPSARPIYIMYAYCDHKLASARLIYIMYAYFDRKLASARPIYIIYAYVDRKLARNANEVRDSAVTHLHNDIPFQQYKYRPHVCLVTVDFNSSSEAVASLPFVISSLFSDQELSKGRSHLPFVISPVPVKKPTL